MVLKENVNNAFVPPLPSKTDSSMYAKMPRTYRRSEAEDKKSLLDDHDNIVIPSVSVMPASSENPNPDSKSDIIFELQSPKPSLEPPDETKTPSFH